MLPIYIDKTNLGAKLLKFDSAKRLCQNITELFFTPDEIHIDQTIVCGLPD